MAASDLLTSSAGLQALSMVGATDADEADWLAGPRAFDVPEGTPFVETETDLYDSNTTITSYGGVLRGDNGPWTTIVHVVTIPNGVLFGTDMTPVGSATLFEEAPDIAFPPFRLHNSRGFTWVAGGGDVVIGSPLECEETLPTEITEDTVLEAGCTYSMPGDEVDLLEGATPTVEPGVTVEVGEGGRLDVEDGTLVARGTEDEPIEFRGTSDEPGHWQGIRINSAERVNVLRHVQIADSGNTTFQKTNVGVGEESRGNFEGPGRASIVDCEITNSVGMGVRVTDRGTLEDFGNNRFVDNADAPIQIRPRHLDDLDGTSTFENNGESYVNVKWTGATNTNTVDTDATWSSMAVPYRFGANDSDDSLILRARVEVEPGTRVESVTFPIRVDPGGTFVASGTEGEPIEFVGTESTQGAWGGLQIDSEADNRLEHVEIADGGGTFSDANLGVGFARRSADPGRVSIRDCEVTNGSGFGLQVSPDSTLEAVENNRFVGNASAPIQLHPRHLDALDGTSTFEDNGESYVNVRWSRTAPNTVETEATWSNLAIPYRFGVDSDDSLFLLAPVEVEPGARIESVTFPIRVDPPGQLVARGTAEEPIEFVGTEDSQGAGGGIQINTEAENVLEHVVVSDGGGTFSNANVGLSEARRSPPGPGRATVRNCEISDSSAWGILVNAGDLTAGNNTFENNAHGDIGGEGYDG